MSIFDRVEAFIPRSAIMQAELVYQRRSMQGQRRRWLRWIWRAILVAGVTMAMILFWGEFAGALLNRDAGPIGERLKIATDGVIFLAVVMHFVLMIQTLSLAANSVARERQNNTWDMLVLTGIDARQIVIGKWWATIQRQWRSYALLAVLRAGTVVWGGAATSRSLMAISYYYGYNYNIILPTIWEILLAGVAVAAFTMLNLPFTAACGVLASTQIRRSAVALGRAISLRLLVVLGTAIVLTVLTVVAGQLISLSFGRFALPWVGNIVTGVIATLLDNGITIGMTLTSIRTSYYDYNIMETTLEAIVSIFLSVGLYIFLTRWLLARAQWQAVREQALPPLATTLPKSGKIELTTDAKRTSTGL